jgi:hypothetical protein
MSRYIDINQLLDEIGTSARSADDPWTLSRRHRTKVEGTPFEPAVMADLGAPVSELQTEAKSSTKIEQADLVGSSLVAGSTAKSSTGESGLFGGLLSAFPLAKGIADLFGLGDEQAPTAALTPYEHPALINFEGAVSGPMSDVTTLSYGSDGLPRISNNIGRTGQGDGPSGQIASAVTLGYEGRAGADRVPVGSSWSGSQDVFGQFGLLAASAFQEEPRVVGGNIPADLLAAPATYPPEGVGASTNGFLTSSFTPADNFTPVYDKQAGSGASSSQQGQSILVQVQAMDSQSFMDRSHDIAQAVRQAMLNMNSLNDVILDL